MTWEEIISRPMTREEAIKQLKEFIILHQEQHGWDVSTIKALEKAIKALEQNPKYRKEAKRWKNKALGQKQEKWIPVSECMPEVNGEYLVTVRGLMGYVNVEILSYANDLYKIDKFDFNDKKGVAGWYIYDAEFGCYEVDNVVAWMPLPQPYKTESEEQYVDKNS